jgi:hypothetical protein
LQSAVTASELEALTTAAFDATEPASLERFFRDLPNTIDHVMVTAGRPHYGSLVDMDLAQVRRALDASLLLLVAHRSRAPGLVEEAGAASQRLERYRKYLRLLARLQLDPRAFARSYPLLVKPRQLVDVAGFQRQQLKGKNLVIRR